jgi:hypothetical protein
MENMIMFAATEAAASPSFVPGYRSASARAVLSSWRARVAVDGLGVAVATAGITGTGTGVTTRKSVAPNLGTDLRHTFDDPHQGSRSRTRCRLS